MNKDLFEAKLVPFFRFHMQVGKFNETRIKVEPKNNVDTFWPHESFIFKTRIVKVGITQLCL